LVGLRTRFTPAFTTVPDAGGRAYDPGRHPVGPGAGRVRSRPIAYAHRARAGHCNSMAKNKINSLTTLHHVPLFSQCSKKELKKIAQTGKEVCMTAGSVVIAEGAEGQEAYVILKGVVSVRRNGRKIAGLGAGAVIGELSLLGAGVRTATVTCDTEVDMLVIKREHFLKILENVPSLNGKVLQNVARRLADLAKSV